MGLFDIFSSSSKSSSSQTTNVSDYRAGAEGGGSAISNPDIARDFIIGSDDIAGKAIDASTTALTTSSNFLADVFTQFLNLTDKRLERADANNAALQEFSAGIISKEQETSDDRLIKIVQYGLIAVGVVVFIQTGGFKAVAGVFK